MSIKHAGCKTAVWQVELLSAHFMQNTGLVPVTVTILWWFKTTFDTGVTWIANILSAKAEHCVTYNTSLCYKHKAACIAILCLSSGELPYFIVLVKVHSLAQNELDPLYHPRVLVSFSVLFTPPLACDEPLPFDSGKIMWECCCFSFWKKLKFQQEV